MWNELCDDQYEAHAMKVINRAILTIAVCFLSFGGYAISTRLHADVPPKSAAYGTETPRPDATVLGD